MLSVVKKFLILSLSCCAAIALAQQQRYALKVHPSGEYDFFPKETRLEKTFSDTTERHAELDKVLGRLQASGFLAAYFDSLTYESTILHAYLNPGEQYSWMNLKNGNADEAILSAVGFRGKYYVKRLFSVRELEKLFNDILSYCENHGYPFAQVKLDSVFIINNIVTASLDLKLKQLVTIDSVRVISQSEEKVVSGNYLQSYIGIKKGDLYNEHKAGLADVRLRALPFIRVWRPSEVIFGDVSTQFNLFIEKKNASRFDGLVGFLPDRAGKVKLTGQVHLRLLNAFKRGELFDVEAQALPSRTQDAALEAAMPYIFTSPFGIQVKLDIHKQDTSYVDVAQELGIQYLLTGGNYVKVFISNKSSSLISTGKYQNATVLPVFADVDVTLYGVGYKYERLDYRFNPRKGFAVEANAASGIKHIRKNSSLPEKLYDSVRLSTTQYKVKLLAESYFPLSRRNVIKLGLGYAHLISKDIFQNELFRFGGLKDLRGFDEQSLLASQLLTGYAEYHYLLEQNSYFFAFFNQAYYNNDSRSSKVEDMPFGFGAGISFESKAGIFSLSYALGAQRNNPVNLQTGKIHFGIVSYF